MQATMAIRNRLRAEVGGENSADEHHDTVVEDGGCPHRVEHHPAGRGGKFVIGAVVALTLGYIMMMTTSRWGGGGGGDGSSNPASSPASSVPIAQRGARDVEPIVATIPGGKDWSHCPVEPSPPKTTTSGRKVEPLWMPTYPTSIPIKPYADLVTGMTGVANGAKSYYRSTKTLKRCHDKNGNGASVQAITCEIVHPIVPCLSPNPSSQSANFGNVVLVAIRNPLTAFPAYHQSKAEKYHNQVGQVDRKEWIEFRDGYVEGTLFAEWRAFIMEWRDMSPYTVADYVPYEYWSDEIRGPSLVIGLSRILEGEGFPVLYDSTTDDGRRGLECLWHGHIREAYIEENKKLVDWYVPRYTLRQLEFMSTGLDAFAREIEEKRDEDKRPGDERLITILREYINAIRAESVDNE